MTSTEQEVIELYESIVNGGVRCFPKYFWDGGEGKEYAAVLTRHLLQKLNTTPEQVIMQTFKSNKLSSIPKLFGTLYGAIDNAFPEQYHPWQLKQTPVGFWQGEKGVANAAEAVRWLIEVKLEMPIDEVSAKVDYRLFHQHDLGGSIQIAFNDSIFSAMDAAYPGKWKPWEFRRLKLEWTDDLIADAVQWLVYEKLQMSPEEAVGAVTYNVVIQYNLITAYRVCGMSMERMFLLGFPELKDCYRQLKDEALNELYLIKVETMNAKQ